MTVTLRDRLIASHALLDAEEAGIRSIGQVLARMAEEPSISPRFRNALKEARSMADVAEGVIDGMAQDHVERRRVHAG